ncbi:MAG: EamA family transporter [Chthoniobacterales bacterium]|nr:EamA family transporter [Chthoniobacterales bacterium]
MRGLFDSWLTWALLSAFFAALTAVFAKAGVQDISSNYATLVRTLVIALFLIVLVHGAGEWQSLSSINARTWTFLILSGLATGGSWLCYFRALKLGRVSQVAPIDKLSMLLVVVFGVVFLGERLSLRNWTGVVLMAAGAFLVAFRK